MNIAAFEPALAFEGEFSMLHAFIDRHREEIISRCRARVTIRSVLPQTASEVASGVPLFLHQLIEALGGPPTASHPDLAQTAIAHGRALLQQGFTLSQVVHVYGDICQSVTELAMELDAPIATDDFRTLNRCLDEAIACAVTEFGRESDQTSSDAHNVRANERMGFFAHELRNLVNTAIVGFEVLKTGNVGVRGTTAAVVDRSLMGLRSLIERSLGEVRLTAGIQNSERLDVADFVTELVPAAQLEADGRRVTLVVLAVEPGLTIEADAQVLSAVVFNLLQNAFKFTRPGTTVTLRVGGSADRVLIQVQDECGGLPGGDGNSEVLFRPFEQRAVDRTGLGIGLAFSRWGAQANNGRLYARNIDDGCMFTVDLPRAVAPAPSIVGPSTH